MPWASFPRSAWLSSPPPHAPLIVGADTLTPLTRSEPGTCRLDVESRGLPGPCPATSCLPVPRVYLTVPYRAPPRISPYLAIPPHICRYDPHPPAALERPAPLLLLANPFISYGLIDYFNRRSSGPPTSLRTGRATPSWSRSRTRSMASRGFGGCRASCRRRTDEGIAHTRQLQCARKPGCRVTAYICRAWACVAVGALCGILPDPHAC